MLLQTMIKLNLSSNSITDHEVEQLAHALRHNKVIVHTLWNICYLQCVLCSMDTFKT